MGLRLPIYPYYVAQGKTGARKKLMSHHNDKARSFLERFERYLSGDEMQRLAFNIIPPQGSRSIPKRGWFRAPLFDEDCDHHAELAKLMDRVGKNGTIVIPNITHIIGTRDKGPPSPATKKLMLRFDEEDIEILPLVIKTKLRSFDLTEYIDTGTPAREVFELTTEIARFAVQHLRHSAMTRNALQDLTGQRQVLAVRARV
jgi:hypothetical protein